VQCNRSRTRTHLSDRSLTLHARVCVTFRLGILGRSNAAVCRTRKRVNWHKAKRNSIRNARGLCTAKRCYSGTRPDGDIRWSGAAPVLRQLPTTLLNIIINLPSKFKLVRVGYELYRYIKRVAEGGGGGSRLVSLPTNRK